MEKGSNAGSIVNSMWQCSPTVCTGAASAPASPNTSGPFIRPWHSLATFLSSALACSAFLESSFLCFILPYSHSRIAGPLGMRCLAALAACAAPSHRKDASRSPMTIYDITVQVSLPSTPSTPCSPNDCRQPTGFSLLYLQCNTLAMNILSLSFQPRSCLGVETAHHCDMAAG